MAKENLHAKETISATYETATGEIPFNMTNDYMFRAVLQKNNRVLRGLIKALLHLSEDDIKEVRITNPIILGESVDSKQMWLDVNVILNNFIIINLEMQIANLFDWRNRSVSYMCRSYDSLNRGGKYKDAKPVIHIGFLDFSLEGVVPEFYATYKLANIKTGQIYSDNVALCVVDLNKTELATDEDKKYGIDKWAKLFKARTWEAVKMLAEEDAYIKDASKTIFELCADLEVKKRCCEREEFEDYAERLAQSEARLADALAQRDAAFAQRDAAFAQRDAAFAQKNAMLAQRNAEKDAALEQAEKYREWAIAHGYKED